jgi:hypothetical protein
MASNNHLEFVGTIISPWVEMLAGRLKCGNCALSMMDSSMSAGWLQKTNFWEVIGKDTDPVQVKVRIKMA